MRDWSHSDEWPSEDSRSTRPGKSDQAGQHYGLSSFRKVESQKDKPQLESELPSGSRNYGAWLTMPPAVSFSRPEFVTSVVDAFHSHRALISLIAFRSSPGVHHARGDLSTQTAITKHGLFADWFICDRKVRIGDTTQSAASYFIEREHTNLSSDALAYAEAFRDSSLRLLLFKKLRKDGSALFEDIVLGGKFEIQNALEVFVALERKQLVEARVVELHGDYFVSPFWMPRPSDAQKIIVKAGVLDHRKEKVLILEEMRGDHPEIFNRIAELSNRCSRYTHVKAVEIFKELPDRRLYSVRM